MAWRYFETVAGVSGNCSSNCLKMSGTACWYFNSTMQRSERIGTPGSAANIGDATMDAARRRSTVNRGLPCELAYLATRL